MPSEFDQLCADLAALQKLKDSGGLAKALKLADEPPHERRQREHRQAIENIGLVRELRPAPGRSKARAAENARAIMSKALALQAEGRLTGLQVCELEARIHRLQASVR